MILSLQKLLSIIFVYFIFIFIFGSLWLIKYSFILNNKFCWSILGVYLWWIPDYCNLLEQMLLLRLTDFVLLNKSECLSTLCRFFPISFSFAPFFQYVSYSILISTSVFIDSFVFQFPFSLLKLNHYFLMNSSVILTLIPFINRIPHSGESSRTHSTTIINPFLTWMFFFHYSRILYASGKAPCRGDKIINEYYPIKMTKPQREAASFPS